MHVPRTKQVSRRRSTAILSQLFRIEAVDKDAQEAVALERARYMIEQLCAVNKDDTASPRTQQRDNRSWVVATDFTNSDITWKILRTHTWNDAVLAKVIEQVGKDFPDSCHDFHPDVKPYHVYRHQLPILDGVLCYKERVVIPEALRQGVLQTLHSAHQGRTGMFNRAEQAVFWTGMSADIEKKRSSCRTCIGNAPSQPAGPLLRPPSPAYPFHLMVGDYFSKAGSNFFLVADRYSDWFSIYTAGEYDAEALIQKLRQHFVTFGVPEEFASDMGPLFKAGKIDKFLKTWECIIDKAAVIFHTV